MALPESNEVSEKKSGDTHKGPDKKEKLLSKVIIRRLPPNMDQETFLNQISPVPTYDYFYMVKGDASLGENSFSRAYINFTNPNDIYDFKEKFDNYVFLDNAGHEYPAVVEFSAFQKIPKRRNKVRVDTKVGTIESDPYYSEFVEMINKPPEQDGKPEYTYQITDTKNEVNEITPLLEYVKNKRVEKMRIREERREERKRKEFERKKFREDERKKRYEEKSPVKSSKTSFTKVGSPKEKSAENKDTEKNKGEEGDKAQKPGEEKSPEKEDAEKHEKSAPTSYYKNRDKKFDDRKKDIKSKYTPKKEYIDKREYKSRRDDNYKERDYRSKYDDYKKEDTKVYQKKVKKYSERREERKIEAQKAEQKKLEQESSAKSEETTKVQSGIEDKPKENVNRKDEEKSSSNKETEPVKESTSKTADKDIKSRDSDSQSRRIRNKDRPTIAIYRPGMLSKRKQGDGDMEPKESKKE